MTDEGAIFERHVAPIAPLATGMAPKLSKIKRSDAILFDVYGTLLISAAGDIEALPSRGREGLDSVLRRHGIHRPASRLWEALRQAVEQEHERMRQQGVDYPEVDIIRIWQEVLEMKDRQRAIEFAMEIELVANPVYPMPGLEELLSACRTSGVAMGIISNAQFYTSYLLERFLGSPLERCGFDERLIFLSYRCGYAKPSPFMFEQAVQALSGLGITAESALYVGNDMLKDILPACRIGFRTALFAGDRRSLRLRGNDPRCRDLSPDLIVTDLRQLVAATVDALPATR